MQEIKPCHCGRTALLEQDKDHHGEFANLGCSEPRCIYYRLFYAVDTSETSIEQMIADWNHRPIEDVLRANIAKLESQLATLRKDNRSLIEQINHFRGVKNMVPEPPEKGE
jgi:hypothetical protein